MILVIFKRARTNMPQRPVAPPEQKKQLILNSLIFLEQILQRSHSKTNCRCVSLSESYFRTVFKEVTGLTPLDYLNRIRVVKALEYMQGNGLSISDAAAKAGILTSTIFHAYLKKSSATRRAISKR